MLGGAWLELLEGAELEKHLLPWDTDYRCEDTEEVITGRILHGDEMHSALIQEWVVANIVSEDERGLNRIYYNAINIGPRRFVSRILAMIGYPERRRKKLWMAI